MTAETSAGLPEAIRCEPELFRLSGMIDGLRDTAEKLMAVDVSDVTLERMRERYNQLRTRLAATLLADAATGLLDWAPDLDGPVTSDELFDAASVLARWIDLTLGLPGFMASRLASVAEIRNAFEQYGPKDGPQPVHAQGQYL